MSAGGQNENGKSSPRPFKGTVNAAYHQGGLNSSARKEIAPTLWEIRVLARGAGNFAAFIARPSGVEPPQA
jgi:hypothetical protein